MAVPVASAALAAAAIRPAGSRNTRGAMSVRKKLNSVSV
jgi:hypothetical protein